MRHKPKQRSCACKHALAFAVAVYTVSVSGRALSVRQQLREPAGSDFVLGPPSQPGQRNPALTDIQSWEPAKQQDKTPALLTATTSGLSSGTEVGAKTATTAATQADQPPAVPRTAHAAAPVPDPSPSQALSRSPGLLAVIAGLPGDDSSAGAAPNSVSGPAAGPAAGSRPAAGTAGMSTGSTAASDAGSRRTGGSLVSAVGVTVSTTSNSTGSAGGSRAANGAASAWPQPDRPSRGETGVTLGNIAAAEMSVDTADDSSANDLATAAATAGMAAAGNAVLGGTAVGGRRAGGDIAAVSLPAANGSGASSSSGCSRNISKCSSVSDSAQGNAADASALRDSSSDGDSSSSISMGGAESSSSSTGASPSVKPQRGHPSADGATVVTQEGAFHVPDRCIIAGSALFSSCALEIYAAQSHFFNLTGPYMGPANYTQLLTEQGVSQAQVLQYLKEALASPSDNCCAALCCFNQLLLCDCEPPVLQLAVSFAGVDEGFYALMSRQLSRSCGIKSFYGESCPAVLAYPGSSAAACTGATWPPVHSQHSGPGSAAADGASELSSGSGADMGHAGIQSVGGSPSIMCVASTEVN